MFVIFSQLDMALSTHQLDSNQDIGSLFFKHPSNIFISGPSGSGKTEFVKKMIEFKEDLFDILPQHIVWCYKEWQKSYNILQEREGSNIKFIQGGGPKPILMKVTNTTVKSTIMRKRKAMKSAGHRLVDDVTKLNTELIHRLTEHPAIEVAWYFNGSVYGKTTVGKRIKFDLHDNIDNAIKTK